MIKKSAIDAVIQDKVILALDEALREEGFKFQKAKKRFVRGGPALEQVVGVGIPNSPVRYDPDREKWYLLVEVAPFLTSSGYESWQTKAFGASSSLHVGLPRTLVFVDLSLDDFDGDSFYQPTVHQAFQMAVSKVLSEGGQKPAIPLEQLLAELPGVVQALGTLSGRQNLYDSGLVPEEHGFYFSYAGWKEAALEWFHRHHAQLLAKIEEKSGGAPGSAKRWIEDLAVLVKRVEQVAEVRLENPFADSLKVLAPQGDRLDFSTRTRFVERLRLDLSAIEVEPVCVNEAGEMLLVQKGQRVVKLDATGRILFEGELPQRTGFKPIFHPSIGVTRGREFHVNNHLLSDTHQFRELPLPVRQGKDLQDPDVSDLRYLESKNVYLMRYDQFLLAYLPSGELEAVVDLGQKHQCVLVPEQGWVVKQVDEARMEIADLQGRTLEGFAHPKGNTKFAFSPGFEHVLCHGYAAKSQLFDRKSGKESVLWAHPTFMKGYKETLYRDTEQNFDLGVARFSPDGTYLVGGAYHGKYVAWKLPSLERIELIPSVEMIGLLEPFRTSRQVDGKRVEETYRSEIVTLEGQGFLYNRRNELTQILFFEEGDLFVTELSHGKFALAWNRQFQNTYHKLIHGKLARHAGKFLTQQSKTEVILYEQE